MYMDDMMITVNIFGHHCPPLPFNLSANHYWWTSMCWTWMPIQVPSEYRELAGQHQLLALEMNSVGLPFIWPPHFPLHAPLEPRSSPPEPTAQQPSCLHPQHFSPGRRSDRSSVDKRSLIYPCAGPVVLAHFSIPCSHPTNIHVPPTCQLLLALWFFTSCSSSLERCILDSFWKMPNSSQSTKPFRDQQVELTPPHTHIHLSYITIFCCDTG